MTPARRRSTDPLSFSLTIALLGALLALVPTGAPAAVAAESQQPEARLEVLRKPGLSKGWPDEVEIAFRVVGADDNDNLDVDCYFGGPRVTYVRCTHLGRGVFEYVGPAPSSWFFVDATQRSPDGSTLLFAWRKIAWTVDLDRPDVGDVPDRLRQRSVAKRRVAFRWKAVDDTRVTSVDVRVRRGASHARRPTWTRHGTLRGPDLRSTVVRLRRGESVCVQVRPHDQVGRVGSWHDVGCATRAYGLTRTRFSDDVRRIRGRRFSGGWAAILRDHGDVARVRARAGSRVALVVTRSRRTGIAVASLPGRRSRTIGFVTHRRGSARHGRVTELHWLRARRSGHVRVRGDLTRRVVVLEGVVVVPRWARR
ncbi:hypothetical protein CLV56_0147 [Mumia flava]|uniref:Uncharacterized protein n=1 Tax=Mumia flava TaxID=1348852 RepID=A0A0B2BID7_9ACTN|nr:hypothetical protein [Mumia flava]PJJ55944.1 hypothetical protein CLV56_0147 [Mumia flava]